MVGNILALQYLGIEKVFTTPVNTGFGFVECAHGQMPVPAPATAELLQGIPNYRGTVEKEMTTPTGAALLKVLASPVKEVPDGFTGETIGYGAGTRDVAIPNVLRVTMGLWNETVGTGNSGSAVERLLMLECNLDDLNPEIMPYVLEKLFVQTGTATGDGADYVCRNYDPGRAGLLCGAHCTGASLENGADTLGRGQGQRRTAGR